MRITNKKQGKKMLAIWKSDDSMKKSNYVFENNKGNYLLKYNKRKGRRE